MANPEHLAILKQGVEAWNAWRKANRQTAIDLQGLDLVSENLAKANLSDAKLVEATLPKATLCWADLSGADLARADLTEANLSECFEMDLRLERRHGRWWAWGSDGRP